MKRNSDIKCWHQSFSKGRFINYQFQIHSGARHSFLQSVLIFTVREKGGPWWGFVSTACSQLLDLRLFFLFTDPSFLGETLKEEQSHLFANRQALFPKAGIYLKRVEPYANPVSYPKLESIFSTVDLSWLHWGPSGSNFLNFAKAGRARWGGDQANRVPSFLPFPEIPLVVLCTSLPVLWQKNALKDEELWGPP